MSARERLLHAAAELLWERGYSATSPAAIQHRAEAGQGSMYHHFGGKPDLARITLQAQAEQLRADFEAVVLGHDGPISTVIAYLRSDRDPLRGCRIGRHTQDSDLLADPDLHAVVSDYFAWVLVRLADLVRAGQADGKVRPDADPEEVAAMLVAAVQGAYVLARATGDPGRYTAAMAGAVAAVRALGTGR